jgi:hypothetical protein
LVVVSNGRCGPVVTFEDADRDHDATPVVGGATRFDDDDIRVDDPDRDRGSHPGPDRIRGQDPVCEEHLDERAGAVLIAELAPRNGPIAVVVGTERTRRSRPSEGGRAKTSR